MRRHVYVDDPVLPDTCMCGLPAANQRHTLPDLGEQTTESRRRAGDSEDE